MSPNVPATLSTTVALPGPNARRKHENYTAADTFAKRRLLVTEVKET